MDIIKAFIEEPIKKKWVYNFIVSPKTSIIEKPEWYLNQTLKRIYENIDIIEKKVKLDSKDLNVKHLFILSMIELAMLRLKKDMKTISRTMNEPGTEEILIHTYNEVIQFTKVIRQLLGDSFVTLSDEHDMLSVFSNQELFEKIVDVEWDCANGNFRNIVSSPTKWDPVLKDEFVDNYKISKCVDSLLMLINSLTERVECFQQLDCQFKLIELQCHLFNKFLTFLKSSTDSNSTKVNLISDLLFFTDDNTIDLTRILRVLNGVNFLRLILKEKYFIPKTVIEQLDKTLLDKANKLAVDYKALYDQLVEKVVGISEVVECNLQEYLDFIEPKLSHHIFETIRDEASRKYQERETQNLLGGLSLS